MSTFRFGPEDMLEYNGAFGVLICRKCQYAIQKSAIEKHLLKHKIYRQNKQDLMTRIGNLFLFEPDDVPLPHSGVIPVPSLPVIQGFRCDTEGCQRLYASLKRSQRHKREVHNQMEFSGKRVTMQTFFQGTKKRYFEVAASPTLEIEPMDLVYESEPRHQAEEPPLSLPAVFSAHDEASTQQLSENENAPEDQTEDLNYAEAEGSRLRSDAPEHSTQQQQNLLGNLENLSFSASFSNQEMSRLEFFHYFITRTSLTLPGESICYWQSDVVRLAFKSQWLMRMLMLLAACHMATIVPCGFSETHRITRSLDDLIAASAATRPATTGSPTPVSRADDSTNGDNKARKQLLNFFTLLGFFQYYCFSLVEEYSLSAILEKIQDCFCYGHDSLAGGSGDESQHASISQRLAHAKQVFGISVDASDLPTYHPVVKFKNPRQAAFLSLLRSLPFKIAQTVPKPSNGVTDVSAQLIAMANLVECCERAFVTDDLNVIQQAIGTWYKTTPKHFFDMVNRGEPVSRIILGYWAISLVRHATSYGCWILSNATDIITEIIEEEMLEDDPDNENLHSLLELLRHADRTILDLSDSLASGLFTKVSEPT